MTGVENQFTRNPYPTSALPAECSTASPNHSKKTYAHKISIAIFQLEIDNFQL